MKGARCIGPRGGQRDTAMGLWLGFMALCLTAGCAPAVAPLAVPRVPGPSESVAQEPTAQLALDYTLRVHADAGRLTRIETRLCLKGRIPKALIPGLPRAGRYLLGASRDA